MMVARKGRGQRDSHRLDCRVADIENTKNVEPVTLPSYAEDQNLGLREVSIRVGSRHLDVRGLLPITLGFKTLLVFAILSAKC